MRGSTYGPAYSEVLDGTRLDKQHTTIYRYMLDGEWHTLAEISTSLGYPEASVSAQIRHLRKPQFGGHQVEKRRHPAGDGRYLYQLHLVHDYSKGKCECGADQLQPVQLSLKLGG
jgi:biotin operon repressor